MTSRSNAPSGLWRIMIQLHRYTAALAVLNCEFVEVVEAEQATAVLPRRAQASHAARYDNQFNATFTDVTFQVMASGGC